VIVLVNIDSLINYGYPETYVSILRERGIKDLNPLQRQIFTRGLIDKDKNIIVVAPTASGKTLIGELLIVKTVLQGFKSVYLVPLKALASEKYDEFKVLERIGFKIGITTGDYESPAEYLGEYDVIVATYERFDSLQRLKAPWIKSVKCVVIDELHNVNDPDRGPVIEMIIARLLRTNARIIGLSATIGNPHVLAKWINAELITDPWRPVKLVEGYYDKESRSIILFEDNGEKREAIRFNTGYTVIDIVLHNLVNNIQTLVFLHNRRKVEEYSELLVENMGIDKYYVDKRVEECLNKLRESPSSIERDKLGKLIKHGVAYHHAGLSSVARRVVEDCFRDRVIKVVFATPTLAAGVNLPARRVLVSIKRYEPRTHSMTNIAVFEYKQMAGRAGRPRYDPYGEAIIIDAKNRLEALKYIKGSIENIVSKLSSERSLRIHILSLIASRDAGDIDSLMNIFKKTLYYTIFVDEAYLKNNVVKIIDQLIEWRMLKTKGSRYEATELGLITSRTYLDPLSVHRYYDNVSSSPSTIYYLHLITLTPDYTRSRPYISDRVVDEFEDEALSCADNGEIPKPPSDDYEYELWLTSYVHAKMLYDWINEEVEDKIILKYGVGPGDIYSAKETASWIASALSRVEQVMGYHSRSRELEILGIRLENGVREDAVELVKLNGVGRVRARMLINHGIRTLEDIVKTPSSVLENIPGFGPRLVMSIKEQARRLLGY